MCKTVQDVAWSVSCLGVTPPKKGFEINNGGDNHDNDDNDESYHDDVGQMCRAQSVDPAGAPHHWGAHVGDGHRQRACGETETRRGGRQRGIGAECVGCLEESVRGQQRGKTKRRISHHSAAGNLPQSIFFIKCL